MELDRKSMAFGIGRKATDEELIEYLSKGLEEQPVKLRALISMKISDYSFHDSVILEVRENSSEQSIYFLLDYPEDWDNNVFEKYILKFNEVIVYTINEIPFGDNPTILEIEELGTVETEFNTNLKVTRNSISIITNAGKRTLQYSTFELSKQFS